jgi:hydrogenase nickel incorporation protein HypA/HybF
MNSISERLLCKVCRLIPPLHIPVQPDKLVWMHELAMTENILNIVMDHASKANARKVISLKLKIGELSSFVDDSVSFCWSLLSQGTICEGATLEITHVAAEFQCLGCGAHFLFQQELTPCPACGGMKAKLLAGEELEVSSIEIEQD